MRQEDFDVPSDLVPLPTRNYDFRPNSIPLTVEECRTALWMHRGNVTKAAEDLKVASMRLRRFIATSPRLIAEQKEAQHQLVDRAKDIVNEALNDPADAGRRDSMAKYVLNSAIGREAGFGTSGSTNVKINNVGPMQIGWANEPGFEKVEVKVDDY